MFSVCVQGQRSADLLGLQASIPDVPASLAASPQPGLPPVATQWQKPPALLLKPALNLNCLHKGWQQELGTRECTMELLIWGYMTQGEKTCELTLQVGGNRHNNEWENKQYGPVYVSYSLLVQLVSLAVWDLDKYCPVIRPWRTQDSWSTSAGNRGIRSYFTWWLYKWLWLWLWLPPSLAQHGSQICTLMEGHLSVSPMPVGCLHNN